jgi:sigma-B regulation protein RsbU (phosphoserine phosphatase)
MNREVHLLMLCCPRCGIIYHSLIQPIVEMNSFFGFSFGRFQLVLLAAALAVSGMYWLILGSAEPVESVIFALIVGNCTAVAARIASPVYAHRSFPADVLTYLAILLPVSAASSLLSSLVWNILSRGTGGMFRIGWGDIRVGIFVTAITGASLFIAERRRVHLEARNRELENQVSLGKLRLEKQEAELKAAHEIQVHLLPREIPQVHGLQVSCAWQPAQSVGGDYFDVLALAPGQMGVCLADVSGKGITAALLMANLQALVRGLAPGSSGPAELCRKLNEVLCQSVAPEKFVTLFYGLIDREMQTLRFENAGHCYPIVLRDGSAIVLREGATVLGLFPGAEYKERSFSLQREDCLLLTTDGVTEAADEADEQFGMERVTESAQAARGLGAHGIRTRIIEDVTRFCKGNFEDDASLIVVTVE